MKKALLVLVSFSHKTVLLPDYITYAKLLQKSEMRKDIVIELSYKGFG